MYPESSVVQQVDLAFLVIFGISVGILVLITGSMAWFLWRYHHKRSPKAADIDGNIWLEIAWFVVPCFIVAAMFFYGWKSFQALRSVPEGAMDVRVTARMWSWSFEYANGKKSDTLVVPVDTPVKLTMTSLDVIHSFYVPAFRIKMDTVPGMDTYAWFEPEETGEFDILCAEYCGVRHAYMLATARIVPQEEFDAWYAGEKEMAPAPGRELVESYGCISCHSLDGSESLGPTFKDLPGRETVVVDESGKETTIAASPDYIRRSITHPGEQLVKGYTPMMPDYSQDVPEADLNRIVDFLVFGDREPLPDGKMVLSDNGCLACHSTDGSIIAAPSLKDVYGSVRNVLAGDEPRQIKADRAYILESIVDPAKLVVEGWDPIMPPYDTLSQDDLDAVAQYMRTISSHAEQQ